MKRFVIGDVHGGFDALMQCVERSPFDPDCDLLISLGDLTDGHTQSKQVLDYLCGLKHFILIQANHDRSKEGCGNVEYGWFLLWAMEGVSIPLWENQGGRATMLSYDYKHENVPQKHIDLLKGALPYYIDESRNLFVHGGFDERYPIEEQDPEYLMWDRDLVYKYGRGYAEHPVKGYKRVFLGHTSTQAIKHDWNATEPIITDNVIALDTGGGWNGKLTIMDVDTLEYWQSDLQTPNQ